MRVKAPVLDKAEVMAVAAGEAAAPIGAAGRMKAEELVTAQRAEARMSKWRGMVLGWWWWWWWLGGCVWMCVGVGGLVGGCVDKKRIDVYCSDLKLLWMCVCVDVYMSTSHPHRIN
jgi:hypothetical protein